ncbi:hypothetical protein GCM10009839_58580 [Catenulispora yoronensis]|uniref:Uncharacterized protein n=1 Tax=Catenulispora yoronensis TaxID=450799 RepID=A0ABP5GIL1_9ACTN
MTYRWDRLASGTAAGSVLVLIGHGHKVTVSSGPTPSLNGAALAELARNLPPRQARQCRRARRRLLRGQLAETRRANAKSRRWPAPDTPP